MIDAHRIAPKLWMGSAPTPQACRVFDAIVLAAEEYQPELPCGRLILAPMDDGVPSPAEVEIALRAARAVNEERRKGRRVLVSCFAGVNRSGLVTALSMMLNGATAKSAISRIREARKPPIGMVPQSNTHFVKLLHKLEPQIQAAHRRGDLRRR